MTFHVRRFGFHVKHETLNVKRKTSGKDQSDGEEGQILPFVAIGVMVAILLTWSVCRTAVMVCERTRDQTAVDATALSAANAYARGLNIVAVSNRVLFSAAVADLGMKLMGGFMAKMALSGGSFTQMVMEFQDIWAGTGGRAPGVAPTAMAIAGSTIGTQNGLRVLLVWNTSMDGGGVIAPSLNVRRATIYDLMIWLAGGRTYGGTDGARGSRVTVTQEKSFSYKPASGGARVDVPADQVEKVTFERNGKTVTQYRMKGKGGKAGKFVKMKKVGKVAKAVDIPLPLIESSPIHRVIVVGKGSSAGTVSAHAETGGGEVFNMFYGDPDYRARLIKVPELFYGADDLFAFEPEMAVVSGRIVRPRAPRWVNETAVRLRESRQARQRPRWMRYLR